MEELLKIYDIVHVLEIAWSCQYAQLAFFKAINLRIALLRSAVLFVQLNGRS